MFWPIGVNASNLIAFRSGRSLTHAWRPPPGLVQIRFSSRMNHPVMPGDSRIKTAILVSGGTRWKKAPEVDSWNYAPRVTIPTLMINGRSDFVCPLESSQLPLLHALGTPAKDKKQVLFEGGHATPVAQPDLMKAYLDWLDQYLGPVTLRP